MGDEHKRIHKRRSAPREWETEDSALLHDERRVLFGESRYLLEYMAMGVFEDVFGDVKLAASGRAVDDEAFSQRFPTLSVLMTHTEGPDGAKRQVCTLTIVCEDGQVKCGINERNKGLSLWVSSQSVGGVFAALEEALGQRPVPWRKVGGKTGGRRW